MLGLESSGLNVLNGGDMKYDPDNCYELFWKFTSFTDFVLLYVKVTLNKECV